MDSLGALQRRLEVTERRVRRLSALTVVLFAAIALGATNQQQVLRARGLIIVDDAGRERIVLGAPMANATTDSKLATTIGIAVLDSLGKLNVAVGTNNPVMVSAQQRTNRIASSSGLNIYDLRTGVERGGIGVMSDGRANMCLDYSQKLKEAACLSVGANDQHAAVILNGGPNEKDYDRAVMWVDADGMAVLKAFGGYDNKGGVSIRAGGKGPASIIPYDSTGKALADILRRP